MIIMTPENQQEGKFVERAAEVCWRTSHEQVNKLLLVLHNYTVPVFSLNSHLKLHKISVFPNTLMICLTPMYVFLWNSQVKIRISFVLMKFPVKSNSYFLHAFSLYLETVQVPSFLAWGNFNSCEWSFLFLFLHAGMPWRWKRVCFSILLILSLTSLWRTHRIMWSTPAGTSPPPPTPPSHHPSANI